MVPRPFVREHYKELGRVVTLENGISRRMWKVSFGSAKKSSSWLQGWRRVAEENDLNPGDVMIFVLVDHSHFRFHLFDMDGNITGTNRPTLQNDARVKIEPSDPYHNHQERVFMGSEEEFKRKKLPRLFDPDLAIVKIEPGLFRRSVSPEDFRPPLDHRYNPITVPAQREEPRVPGFRHSPDSELTISDGDETIARGKAVRDTRCAPDTRRCLSDLPQIAVNNVDTPGEKDVSTARCVERTSRQSNEGCKDDPAKRKLEFDTTKKLKPVEEESCLANNGIITQQITSMQVPPQETNANPPEAPFNPRDYFVESKRRMTTALERKRAWDKAKAYAESLPDDHFVLVMTDDQVYTRFYMPLPAQFVLDTKFPSARTTLRLVDWNGSKTWEVYSRINTCNEISFYRSHWGVFSLEHFLEEGDVCVFQLVDRDTFTISVRIFRVLQLPKFYTGRSVTFRDHYGLRPIPKS
ncbi:hypothetical protein M758_1G194800 [Ceratodon purpureus]|nr:hypothetical protein M758_1G194800 [Ceratodon purpureus]